MEFRKRNDVLLPHYHCAMLGWDTGVSRNGFVPLQNKHTDKVTKATEQWRYFSSFEPWLKWNGSEVAPCLLCMFDFLRVAKQGYFCLDGSRWGCDEDELITRDWTEAQILLHCTSLVQHPHLLAKLLLANIYLLWLHCRSFMYESNLVGG